MDIKRNGSRPSSKGPADWFIGTVLIDHLFQPTAPARATGQNVTFEPVRAPPHGTLIRWGSTCS